MIAIKDISGKILLSVSITEGCERVEELMKSDYAQLSWNSNDNITIPAGAYIEYKGEKLFLLEPYVPEQKDELEFNYKPQFHSRIIAWGKIPFFYYTETDGAISNREADWSLTDNPLNFMSIVVKAIKNETGETWAYSVDASLPASTTLSFQSVDIFSALNQIAAAFETEWWVDKVNNVIHLSKASHGTPVILEVGKNISAPSITSRKEGYYTRFYAFGSTRNIVQDYKGANVNNLVNKRLTLDPAKYPGGYKDIRNNLRPEEIFSKVLIFDDIYPSSKLTISDVRSRLMYRIDDKSNKIQVGTDSEGNPIYDQYAIWYFRIPDFNFNNSTYSKDNPEGMKIPGKNPTVHFESGSLAGRDFELFYHDTDRKETSSDGLAFQVKAGDYEIKFIEEDSLILPMMGGEGLVPTDNNKIILFNIKMPEEYITSAYVDLETALDKEIERLSSDFNNYQFNSNPVWFNDKKNNPNLSIGQSVTYKNGSYSYSTRVIKLVIKMDYECEQSITVGNEKIKGSIQEIKEEVVSANRDLDLLASINNMTSSLQQSYSRTQQMILDGFSTIKNMWKFDPNDPNVIYSPYHVYSQKGVSAYGQSDEGGSGAGGGVSSLYMLDDVNSSVRDAATGSVLYKQTNDEWGTFNLTSALGTKVDKVAGKGLSSNDFSNTWLNKLKGIEEGANKYILKPATAALLGGIMVGSTLSVNAQGVLNYDLTKAKIENVLTGNITSHNHDSFYYRKSYIDDLFQKVNVGTAASPVWAIRANYPLFSIGGVSAYGQSNSGSTGGIDEEQLWSILGNNGLEQISKNHLTTALSDYATIQRLSDYATINQLSSYATTLSVNTALANKVGSTRKIIAGNGLAGGGTLTSDVTLSLGTINTAGTYYKVTTDKYGRVTSGVKTLSVSDITNLQASLDNKLNKDDFYKLFTVNKKADGSIESVQANFNFFSISGISAYGFSNVGSGSGSINEDQLWSILGNSGTEQIAKNHLTTALSNYVTVQRLNDYVDRTSEQTIGGKKTFTGGIYTNYLNMPVESHAEIWGGTMFMEGSSVDFRNPNIFFTDASKGQSTRIGTLSLSPNKVLNYSASLILGGNLNVAGALYADSLYFHRQLVATRNWVNDQNYLTSHQSLDNYVDRLTDQQVGGRKTFKLPVQVPGIEIIAPAGEIVASDGAKLSGGGNSASPTWYSRANFMVYGDVYADKFIVDGPNGFLKANGDIDTNTYLTSANLANYIDKTSQQDITGLKIFKNNLTVSNIVYSKGDGNRGLEIDVNGFHFIAATGNWARGMMFYNNAFDAGLGAAVGAYGTGNTLTYYYYGASDYANASMYITPSNKYVGLGTKTPTEKLDVIGNVKATGFIVSGQSGFLKANGKVDDNKYLTSYTNNYLTDVSGSGNGNVTFARAGLIALTWNAAHTHSQYLTSITKSQVEGVLTGNITTHTHRILLGKYTTRPTNINIAATSDRQNSLEHIIASSSVTTGRPAIGDSHILHFNWDNTGGWDVQLAVGIDNSHMQVRRMLGRNNAWSVWNTILDETNYTSFLDNSYLKLTGGRVTGETRFGNAHENILIPLVVENTWNNKTTIGNGVGIDFKHSTLGEPTKKWTLRSVSIEEWSNITEFQLYSGWVNKILLNVNSHTGLIQATEGSFAVSMTRDTSAAKNGLSFTNVAGSVVSYIGYHNTEQRLFLSAKNNSNWWTDQVGKYQLKIGVNSLTYNTYEILRSDNYGSFLNSQYLRLTGGIVTGTTLFTGGKVWKALVGTSATTDHALFQCLDVEGNSKGYISVGNTFKYNNGSNTYDVIHSGNIGSQSVNYANTAGGLKSFSSSSTAGTYTNQYTKIASIRLTSQYANAQGVIAVYGSGDGYMTMGAGILSIRVKQQHSMGGTPYVSLYYIPTATGYYTSANFKAVVVSNTTTETVVDFYLYNTVGYNSMVMRMLSGDGITLYSAQGYSPTLPAGTVVTCASVLGQYVDRSNDQDISGNKTFNDDIFLNGSSYFSGINHFGVGSSIIIDKEAPVILTNPQMSFWYAGATVSTKVGELSMDSGGKLIYTKVIKASSFEGNASTATKVANALTFSSGTFAGKTYNGSAATTVNIPTHTSHLTNNSGFLTSHQSLANYVNLNGTQTITGTKTFSSIYTDHLDLRVGSFAEINGAVIFNEGSSIDLRNPSIRFVHASNNSSTPIGTLELDENKVLSYSSGMNFNGELKATGLTVDTGSVGTYPSIMAGNGVMTNRFRNNYLSFSMYTNIQRWLGMGIVGTDTVKIGASESWNGIINKAVKLLVVGSIESEALTISTISHVSGTNLSIGNSANSNYVDFVEDTRFQKKVQLNGGVTIASAVTMSNSDFTAVNTNMKIKTLSTDYALTNTPLSTDVSRIHYGCQLTSGIRVGIGFYYSTSASMTSIISGRSSGASSNNFSSSYSTQWMHYGTIKATGSIVANSSSDRRLKENIIPLERASNIIKTLRFYEYDYKKWALDNDSGLIPHSVGMIYDEVIGTRLSDMAMLQDSGYGSLNYMSSNYINIIAASVKETIERTDILENKMTDVESRIALLEKENKELKEIVSQLKAA